MKWYGIDITKVVEPEAAAPAEAGTLVIGTTDKITVLDPADSYDFHTWEMHHNTRDTLLHTSPAPPIWNLAWRLTFPR